MSEPVIQTRDLTKEFVRDEFHVVALIRLMFALCQVRFCYRPHAA